MPAVPHYAKPLDYAGPADATRCEQPWSVGVVAVLVIIVGAVVLLPVLVPLIAFVTSGAPLMPVPGDPPATRQTQPSPGFGPE
jgi:hypothetical protein